MRRALVVFLLFASACAPAGRVARPAAPPAAAAEGLSAADRAAIDAVVREGTANSHVGADLEYLTDVIGPRLTGSEAMRRANDWMASRFREYGMDSVWLEPWRFGRVWERGPMTLTLLAPHRRQLIGESWAWAPGTDGPLSGDVVMMDARSIDDFRRRFAGRIAGKWVLGGPSTPIWNPDGPPMTARDSARLDSARAAAPQPTDPEFQRLRRGLVPLLAAENVAGFVRDGAKEFALLTMSGSPESPYPFPYVTVPHETYTQFERLLARGERVTLQANITNTLTGDTVEAYNTVAEIRGAERPDEVVLLGAHLDSWDLGTGATDNGTGSVAVLEAARILRAAGVRPRRTIRFALFSGEEQGLIGSERYAEAHAAELRGYQAVLVLDNGTGRVTGMSLQGRDDLRDLWRQLFAPVTALGPFEIRSRNKGGTDHLSFLPYGVPAFNYDQATRGYNHTHHSQADTFDHAVVEDVAQAATVMAATAYELANLPALLTRNPSKPAVGTRD
jgi:hypothetical protein